MQQNEQTIVDKRLIALYGRMEQDILKDSADYQVGLRNVLDVSEASASRNGMTLKSGLWSFKVIENSAIR